MLIFKTENNERKIKKSENMRTGSHITLLLNVQKQRNTGNVFPRKPGPLLPWKNQFLVHSCHKLQRKELQSSSPSRHKEILSFPGEPIPQVFPGSIAYASNDYFKFLDCNRGFSQFYNFSF